jgi:hypothetical protein
VFQFNFHSASFPRAPRVPRGLNSLAVYLVVILATFSLATLNMRAQDGQPAATPAATATPNASPQPGATTVKPTFSLATNRTYGTHEKTRVYVNYQGINSLDFRVYKIKDPFKFFKQLANPHNMGEDDREYVSAVTETQSANRRFWKSCAISKAHFTLLSKGISVRNFAAKPAPRSTTNIAPANDCRLIAPATRKCRC